MIELMKIALCFFALCGLMYLVRDGVRLYLARQYAQPFSLVLDAGEVETPQAARRLFSLAARLISHPEAKRMVGKIYLVGAPVQRFSFLYETARDYDLQLVCVEGGLSVERITTHKA